MATQKNNVLPRRSSLKPVEAEKIQSQRRGSTDSSYQGFSLEEANKAKEICQMLGAKGLRSQEHISFKDVVRQEINRPLSHWELMVNQSKVAPALGRRVFDEEEIFDNEDNSGDEEKAKKKKSSSPDIWIFIRKMILWMMVQLRWGRTSLCLKKFETFKRGLLSLVYGTRL